MSRSKCFVAYMLLFVFMLLSFKNLLSNVEESSHGNCQEFGHLHFHKLAQHHQNKSRFDFIKKPSAQPGEADDDDDDCHEGKSVMSYSPFPTEVFDYILPKHELVFDVVFSADNNFKSPSIEPQRKPPKVS